jgi:hypothetical protein
MSLVLIWQGEMRRVLYLMGCHVLVDGVDTTTLFAYEAGVGPIRQPLQLLVRTALCDHAPLHHNDLVRIAYS